LKRAQRPTYRLAVTTLRDVQVRDATGTGDGSFTIEGYAAVFEQETTLWDLPGWWRVREEIARDAFTRADKNPVSVIDRVRAGAEIVHLNHGHDMKTVMAASDVQGIGGLELDSDFHGLRFFARVDPEDADARSLAVKMSRGIIKQASFAFTIADEERIEVGELEDGTLDELWRINEIGNLYDVCVCAQGAYSQTESYLRSLAAASLRVPDLGALGRAEPAGHPRRGQRPGESSIAPVPVGEGSDKTLRLAQLRAHAGVTTRTLTRRHS
jgi:HK97 family phage prohead protease